MFLFSNISLMNQYLILGLKAENPRLTWMLFEDGAETYSPLVGSLVQSASLKVRLQLYAVQRLKGAYLFHPETLDWKPACPVYKLPGEVRPGNPGPAQSDLSVRPRPDRYDRPVVFFEESYPCDGVDIGDLALVNRLAELVGKENIFVKTHPRNQENRFKKAGYATNRDSTTPWELVILNTSFAHTLLVTVGSSAATNPSVSLASLPRLCFCAIWWRTQASCARRCWCKPESCAPPGRTCFSFPKPGRSAKRFSPGS